MSSNPGPSKQSESDSTDKAAYEKRREQVRRAQRVHRDRRAVYLTSLENEVKTLRTETAALRAAADENADVKALEREVAQLRSEKAEHLADAQIIEKLKDLLENHGIALPPELRLTIGKEYNAAATLHGQVPSAQYLQVTLPGLEANAIGHEQVPGYQAAFVPTTNVDPHLSHHSSEYGTGLESEHSNLSQLICEDDTDGTQTAVDFVLALEQICLHHHKFSSSSLFKEGELGSGHTQMLQSPIMARLPEAAPHHPQIPLQMDVPVQPGCSWSVPATELERLLALSQSLPLNGEVTPVQIWQRLRAEDDLARVTQERLDCLRDQLIPHVMCYGFGAVVVEDLVESIFDDVFEGTLKW